MIFSPMIERAVELAAEWHDRTYRKSRWRPHPFEAPATEEPGRIPVMAHVTAVALEHPARRLGGPRRRRGISA
jgi:hypothetical protein